jgi:hypothetical protein
MEVVNYPGRRKKDAQLIQVMSARRFDLRPEETRLQRLLDRLLSMVTTDARPQFARCYL